MMNATRERVASLIREAFQGVTLGNGVGLWQGRALDDYAAENEIAAARLRDERTDWRTIPIEDLCECESSLTFADAEGARFLLPAFLLAQLEDKLPVGVTFVLTNHYNYRPDDHFAALSSTQRKAVREFLLALRDDPQYEPDRQDIDKSLAKYWTE